MPKPVFRTVDGFATQNGCIRTYVLVAGECLRENRGRIYLAAMCNGCGRKTSRGNQDCLQVPVHETARMSVVN